MRYQWQYDLYLMPSGLWRSYSRLKTKLLLLLLSALFTNCAVIKSNPNEKITKIEKSDFKKLNGQFSNYPIVSNGTIERDMVSTTFEPISLWSQIDGFKQPEAEDSIREQSVTLDFVSKKRAIAKLWDRSELRETKTIRGRIKDGYFYRRPYFFAVPLVPLFFGYKTYRYRVGISDDSIVVDYRWNFWGFAIAAGSYGRGKSNSIFERKERQH